MITHNEYMLKFLGNDLHSAEMPALEISALEEFRKVHPADLACTGAQAISSSFEQQGACNLSLEFLERAYEATAGISRFYFSGLIFAHTELKREVEQMCNGSRNGAINAVDAKKDILKLLDTVCRQRFATLYSSAPSPHLAFDFAVLETSICLMTHSNPAEGKKWLHRLNMA
jgi:hypothetical protein